MRYSVNFVWENNLSALLKIDVKQTESKEVFSGNSSGGI